MSNTVIHYYQHVVAPYLEYSDIAERDAFGREMDLRRAMDAASAVFHLRERLPDALALTRKHTEQVCRDYGLLGDVVNCVKHGEIDKTTPHGSPLVTKAEDVFDQAISISYADENGPYSAAFKVVVAKLRDGTERYLMDVLTNVLTFWDGHLFDHGVLSKRSRFTFRDPLRYRTRSECSQLNLEISQEVPAHFRFRFMRFDQAQHRAVPIDLTGAEVRFTVYNPKPVEVHLRVEKDDGTAIEVLVRLNEAEGMEFSSFTSDEERERFLARCPAVVQAVRRKESEGGSTEEETEPNQRLGNNPGLPTHSTDKSTAVDDRPPGVSQP